MQRHIGSRAVHPIGFGAMSIGGMYAATTPAEAFACLDAAIEGGMTHFDTSNIYGMGLSETLLGDWMADRRPDLHLATKVGIIPGPPRRYDNSADYIRAELEGSLRRLRKERVDLYYIHRRDQTIPVEDVAGTMGRLIDEGLIGDWGLSEVAPATLRRAHAVRPVAAVQSEYSLWSRQPELGLVQACAQLGVTLVAFSPLGRGIFSDMPMVAPTDPFRAGNPRFIEPNLSANQAQTEEFRQFAHARGWTVPALALAWLLDRAPHILPIPGTRGAAHLAEWLPAVDIRLNDADRAEIERLLPVGWAHGDRYSDSQLIGVERYC